jgi:hypothetical protein
VLATSPEIFPSGQPPSPQLEKILCHQAASQIVEVRIARASSALNTRLERNHHPGRQRSRGTRHDFQWTIDPAGTEEEKSAAHPRKPSLAAPDKMVVTNARISR